MFRTPIMAALALTLLGSAAYAQSGPQDRGHPGILKRAAWHHLIEGAAGSGSHARKMDKAPFESERKSGREI